MTINAFKIRHLLVSILFIFVELGATFQPTKQFGNLQRSNTFERKTASAVVHEDLNNDGMLRMQQNGHGQQQQQHNQRKNKSLLFATITSSKQDDDNSRTTKKFSAQSLIRKVSQSAIWLISSWRRIRKVAVSFGIALSLSFMLLLVPSSKPPSAHASAPVMAIPKSEATDPGTQALQEYERRMVKKRQDDLKELSRQAREVEAKGGESARSQFEKEHKEQERIRSEEKTKGLKELKLSLLEQGIVPFIDPEGRRQVILYEKGVDLGLVPGTPFHLEKTLERTAPKQSMAHKIATHRKIIAIMVQDMKQRGIDPVEYFEAHPDKIESILNLPLPRAAALLREYLENMEHYGQITPPKAGEKSMKEKLEAGEKK